METELMGCYAVRPYSVGQQATATGVGVIKAGANKVTSSLFIEAVMLAMHVDSYAKRHHSHSGWLSSREH